jgi:hypothetical protein
LSLFGKRGKKNTGFIHDFLRNFFVEYDFVEYDFVEYEEE